MSTISEISLRNTAGAASNVDIEEQGQANYKDIPVLEKSSSQDLAESYAAALAFNSQLDNGSSNYNSVRPSFQPSPVRSYINLHHLDPQELNSVTWIPFRCHEIGSDSTGSLNLGRSSSYATAEVDFNSDAAERHSLVSRDLSQDSAELSSARISETGSVLIRETGLASAKNKLGDTLPRGEPVEKLEGQFKERFLSIDATRTVHASIPYGTRTKRSGGKSAQKNHETTRHHRVISVGASSYGLTETRKRVTEDGLRPAQRLDTAGKPGLEEGVAILWKEARIIPAHQAATPIDGLNPYQAKTNLRGKRKPNKRYARRLYSPGLYTSEPVQPERGTIDITSLPPSNQYDAPQNSAHNTPSDTRGSIARTSRNLGLPPKSWSRYPSHTRHERNGLEEVGLRDLAPALPDRLETS
ncbi:unnamed protein product [Clonostachys chloroleuca]|uniref:Uncharacterized protein n=1 Tax=Clonostachys chloroleuca TaxID=1926264 RepID=A0AA35Q9T6_9HYPO|nr:unnamed protein product [Clonostachys chloroleuca]